MGAPFTTAPRRAPRARAVLTACVVLWSLCCAPNVASAAPPGNDGKRAVELFEQSAAAYDAGQFAQAAKLLKEAYQLRPDPVLLYNLARAYEGMGSLGDAVQAYADFLGAEPSAKDRGAIEARITTLRAQIDEQARLEREAAERAREAQAARLRTAEEWRVNASLRRRGTSPIPWIIAGAGGVALATGAVLGVLSIARHDAATTDAQADVAADQSQARSFATAANIGLIAGGVLAAAGVAWGVVDLTSARSSPDGSPGAVSLQLGPACASLMVRSP
jgi:tetratricopeptide (TPR) repeat protein